VDAETIYLRPRRRRIRRLPRAPDLEVEVLPQQALLYHSDPEFAARRSSMCCSTAMPEP